MARRNLSLFINGAGRSVLYRNGFSWWAFVALPLWAVHRRLWWCLPLTLLLPALVYGLVNDLLLERLSSAKAQGLLAIGWLVAQSWFMGHWANRAHLAWLHWRGYQLTATEVPPDRWPRHPAFTPLEPRP